MPFFQCKNWQEYKNTQYGHHQASNSPCCQRKPESFLSRTHHKGDEPENGRYHCQEDGHNLSIPCLHISTYRHKLRETTTDGIELIHNVDAGINRNTAQQDKRCKTSLVEIQTEQIKREKDTDV